MYLKARVNENSYLMNCEIVRILKKVRGTEEDYDLVEVKCNNWQDIRQIFFDDSIGIPEEYENEEIVTWLIKENEDEKDVYEEYRQRLVKSNVPIIRLEIYETFAGTDYIHSTLDLVDLLQSASNEDVIEELENIGGNISQLIIDKSANNQKLGYMHMVEGYILRLKARC